MNVLASLSGLRPTTLETLDRRAALQTRVDRKYLVGSQVFEELVATFGDRLQALEIDGRRTFGYRSVYFDTAELTSFHAHLQRRRRRFKVRTRTYLHSGKCRLEVKTKGSRTETVKKRMRYPTGDAAALTDEGREFVHLLLGPACATERLQPALETRYRRATLLDAASGSRITCDAELSFLRGDDAPAGGDGAVLVETKSPGGAGPVDRWLWRQHVRPESLSKYCVGVAMLYPGVRSNPWHRVLRRHFDWPPGAVR